MWDKKWKGTLRWKTDKNVDRGDSISLITYSCRPRQDSAKTRKDDKRIREGMIGARGKLGKDAQKKS